MKKSIIAAGAASVALAAMPIVGVFAETQMVADGSASDNINVEITSGCSVSDAIKSKTVAFSVAPGTTSQSTAAGSISIVCTGVNWAVTAAGDGEANYENSLTQTVESPATPERIASAASTTEGTSNWRYKVASVTNVNGTITPKTGVTDFHQVPAKATPETLAEGTAAVEGTINTQYEVYASLTQGAGNYTGKVTYTVSHEEEVQEP